ncbi:MAG: Zn-ribbon domain-containing OB-fold protein [Candidatus Methanomethylophilaceae archaeon]|nr:Zn-ribbon domain-containing OB-fold protein [Candidatus Methanomethylophilaceae archaeon]
MASVAKEWREIPGRYNLIGSKCTNCGKNYFPSRDFCPVCRRKSLGKMEKHNVCRNGEVFTYTVIYDAPDCNNRIKPYAAVMVRTDDGVMITGQLVDVDLGAISIGMRVRAVLRKLDADGSSGVIHYGFKFVPDN